MKINKTKDKARISPWGLDYKDPVSGKRKRRFFATKNDRDNEANKIEERVREHGASALDIDIAKYRLWMQAEELLDGDDIIKAVQFYVSHHPKHLISVSNSIDAFMDNRERQGVSADYMRHVKKILNNFLGATEDVNISNVTEGKVRKWLDSLSCTDETLKNYRKILRAWLGYCQSRKWITANPTDGIEVKRSPLPEPKILSVQATQDLLRSAWIHDKGIAARMALEAFGGLRASAAGRLEYSEIQFEEKALLVPAEKMKKRRRHHVDNLPENLWPWLEGVSEEDFNVSQSQYMHRKSKEVLRSGLDIPRNGLRKSFVSYHVAWKRSADQTALIVSHKNARVLFEFYRGIATQADGEKYFRITP